MMIEIEFNYHGKITIIQCNNQDNLNDLFQTFADQSHLKKILLLI